MLLPALSLSIFAVAILCSGEEVLFQDDFTKADPGWPVTASGFSIKDGKFLMEVEANSASLFLNRSHVFQGMSASVNAQVVHGGIHSVAGFVFWAQDYKNYWAVLISNGTIGIFRYVNDERQVISGWENHAEIKEAIGETNLLKVTIRADQVVVNINGKDSLSFKGFKGTPPQGGGAIGMKGSSESGGATPSTIAFSNLNVTK